MNDTDKAIKFEVDNTGDKAIKELRTICKNLVTAFTSIQDSVSKMLESLKPEITKSLDEIKTNAISFVVKYREIEKETAENKKKTASARTQISKALQSGNITEDESRAYTADTNKKNKDKKTELTNRSSELGKEWMVLAKDLKGRTLKEIDGLVEDINKELKSKGLEPLETKDFLKGMEEVERKANPQTGFGKWNKGAKDLKKAKQDWKNGDATLGETEEAIDKAKTIQNAGATQSFKEMGAVAAPVNDMLKMFNIKSPAVDGVVGALTSLGEVNFAEPMSVITGGLKAVASLMKGIFGENDAAIERDIQRSKEAVKVLKKSYEELDEAIKGAYSYDAATQIASQQANLELQNDQIRKQKELEDSKKTSDKQAIKGYDDAIEANNKQIRELKKSAQNAVFGEDVKSAIDNFASAYMDAWAGGEDKAKSQRDVVKNMIKGMVEEMMKSKIAETVQKMRDKIEELMTTGDKTIDKTEEAEIYEMANQAAKEQESIEGTLGRFVKDDPDTREATAAKGFGSITQDSADELNGRFTAMQITLLDVHKSQLDMLNLQQLHLPSLQHLSQLTHLSAISDNTAYCRRLEGIQLDMNTVKNELQTINIKGITIRS